MTCFLEYIYNCCFLKKNRLQYYARFNNTETNANCVYRVYTIYEASDNYRGEIFGVPGTFMFWLKREPEIRLTANDFTYERFQDIIKMFKIDSYFFIESVQIGEICALKFDYLKISCRILETCLCFVAGKRCVPFSIM